MNLSTLFGFGSSSGSSDELPDIFPIPITELAFVETDIFNIYCKILTDVIERTHGLPDDQHQLLWDNCVKSESSDGLVSMVAKAMSAKKDLFLVYDKALKILRKATEAERSKIEADYQKSNTSTTGVFISFKNYMRSDLIKLYSTLEFCTVASLYKSMNLSKAIQLKMSDLRGTVSLTDSAGVKAQALLVAQGLAGGKDVLLDQKDEIETSKPDLTAIKESIMFLNQKRSFYLGMPASYISGEVGSTLSDTGRADAKAVERGLKNYFASIIKPVLEAVFGATSITYKSQDLDQITGSMETLKTLSLVDNELVSLENKTLIINRLLDLPEDAKGDPPEKIDQMAVDPLTGKPVVSQKPPPEKFQ